MSEYRKVVVGVPLEDPNSPRGDDCEDPLLPSANEPPPLYQAAPLPSYAAYPPPPPPPQVILVYQEDPAECCSQVGCLLSWIPIIGMVNFCVHLDAPPMSRRQWFAQMSCYIATAVIILNIIFWITYTESADDDCYYTGGCRR